MLNGKMSFQMKVLLASLVFLIMVMLQGKYDLSRGNPEVLALPQ